jgi:hypothetical protein
MRTPLAERLRAQLFGVYRFETHVFAQLRFAWKESKARA